MNMIDQSIFEFLKTQEVGVLAVEMPDGSPHGACVHFAHGEEPFMFYFETNRNYKKSEALLGKKDSRATFVVGTGQPEMKTMQLDGVVHIVDGADEQARYNTIYFKKFPKKEAKAGNPDVVQFVFIPTWWRFTDWTVMEGDKKVRKVFLSE